MQEDFNHYGITSDKISHHGYGRFYTRFLEPLRPLEFGMVEIGISRDSIYLWQAYFPKAHIYGLDISLSQSVEGNRLSLIKCDQTNIKHIKYNHKILFINDDGSHVPEHQWASFGYLFNNILEPGGVYIIEDIETSYWKRGSIYGYTITGQNSIVEKFKQLIDSINSEFSNQKLMPSISTITFGQNCIIIQKKESYEYAYNNRKYRFEGNTK